MQLSLYVLLLLNSRLYRIRIVHKLVVGSNLGPNYVIFKDAKSYTYSCNVINSKRVENALAQKKTRLITVHSWDLQTRVVQLKVLLPAIVGTIYVQGWD